MEKKNIFKNRFLWIFLLIAVMFLGFISCFASELNKIVFKAYDLRMNGKADEAREILEQAVSNNQTNAEFQYELARTRFQMALANPRELLTSLNEVGKMMELAIKYDPTNVIYAFFSGRVAFFQAYIALQRDPASAKEKVEKLKETYEKVIELKPDYQEAFLYLVEINSVLNSDQGGDSLKAEYYTEKLEKMNKISGAKARSLLLPHESDLVKYWNKVLKIHKKNATVYEELGKAYMSKGEEENCMDCFEKAIKLDPVKKFLFLDLARYHLMMVMRDSNLKSKALPLAEEAIKKYQSYTPDVPLQAFSLEILAKIKFGEGDKDGVKKLREDATYLDPFYSKAFGVPSPDLFVPPGKESHHHRYLFRPF